MCRIRIEEFLGDFYSDLRKEYQSESMNHEELYKKYVQKETREKIEEKNLNVFYSDFCYPEGWKQAIQLFVNMFIHVDIYFYSTADLQRFVNELVLDSNFKELVMVAFYIKDNIPPKD